MKQVTIFTDGACSGNPGAGGWAALLRFGEHEKLISGTEKQTTNNRMELRAAIEGLKALKNPCYVIVVTDSQYVRKGITEWIIQWEKRAWKTSNNEAVKNIDLWQELLLQSKLHKIEWQWVKGHSNHPENTLVDKAAKAAINKE